jgi:hypothetical protein
MNIHPLGPENPLKEFLHFESVKVAIVLDATATWRSAKNERNRMDMQKIMRH